MSLPNIDLRGNPFFLNDEDLAWVEQTLNSMDEEEKIEQLLFPALWGFTEEHIDEIMNVLHPSGVMLRPCPAKEAIGAVNMLRKKSRIPMLISANLEKGGNGIVSEGTMVGAPLAVAATDDIENERHLAKVCAREARAVGANWGFAPIIDIDYNYRNPIMNTRTLGSDPKKVAEYGRAFTEECQKLGVAVSIKHFPGDGRDERDQHLVINVNDMSCEDWMETYGNCYKQSIEAGALTVMAGHIMQPAWQKRLNPALKDEELMPATLSPELIGPEGLLRKVLGFIACGADIFLFNRNIKEDLEYMQAGVREGVITKERLDEAVCRILALKAALKLYKQTEDIKLEDALPVLGCEEHTTWAKEIADQAITLVKEEKDVLPLNPEKKRVLFYPVESDPGYEGSAYAVKSGACQTFAKLLEKEGFKVNFFVPSPLFEGATPRCDSVTNNYDYIIYMANYSTKSNQTTVRIEWAQPMGANCPVYVTSVPTIFISIENPYHLQDVPRVKTYINTYGADNSSLEALVEKLMGRSQFKGKSPVDAFCGKWDTHL